MTGKALWITGLPGSGKSTIALEVAAQFKGNVAIIDGDFIRKALWPGLGFNPEDRHQNCLRTARLALMVREMNDLVIVALVSPLKKMRQDAFGILGDLLEVGLSAPWPVLKDRRPSLYKIEYEPPSIIFDTFRNSVTKIGSEVVELLSLKR